MQLSQKTKRRADGRISEARTQRAAFSGTKSPTAAMSPSNMVTLFLRSP